MSQNFKVLFYLKKGRNHDKASLPVYVRVTINGQRAEWSVQRKWSADRWSQSTGRGVGKTDDVKELNKFLDAVNANIFEIQREYTLKKEPITALQVRAQIHHEKEEKQYSLIEVYQYHNDQFRQLVGAEYSFGTFKKFKSALKSLKAFIQWNFKKDNVYLTEVNHKFITDYEFYLKTEQKLQHNSAMVNVKKLKKIIRLCVANDWLDKDPFRSYKITTKETHRNFLLKDELETLRTKPITVVRLDQVRDVFLFSCYTGLSFTDVMQLTRNEISVGIDGEQWIFTKRTKTNTASRIPLLPVPSEIMDKYASDTSITVDGRLLPNLTNQKMNTYLKELTDICEIKKELTFHCARHTFATTVTLTNGVPIETVSKMLGHKSLRTTQIYAKILDTKISDDMKALRAKLTPAKQNEPLLKAQ